MPSLAGGPDPQLKNLTDDLHVTLAWVLFGVAALHVAGTLKHHFLDHDDTLRRMLPWARRRASDYVSGEPLP